MKKTWNTKVFVAIGALAALFIVLSLPGAVAAGVTGLPLASAMLNIIVIGIMYSLVPLLIRRFGATTLWALVVAILALPLPLAAPSGFLLKIPYIVSWGLLADITYWLFRRSDKVAAVVIAVIQVGLGGPIAIFLWTYLGAPQLAADVAKFTGLTSVIIASILGAGLGFLAYFIYKKLENTAVVKRIQEG